MVADLERARMAIGGSAGVSSREKLGQHGLPVMVCWRAIRIAEVLIGSST